MVASGITTGVRSKGTVQDKTMRGVQKTEKTERSVMLL